MEDSEKVQLIRKGNQAFNEGNIDLASKIFKTTEYKDGLIRVGDHYYFDKHQPLMAYGYYKRANHHIMLEKISDGFIFALKHWLGEDETKKKEVEN